MQMNHRRSVDNWKRCQNRGLDISPGQVRLLNLINEHHPKTLSELARLSGHQTSNLSRTLKTMEKYGIVELRKHGQKVQPVTKASELDIQYAIG
ncbi:MAG: MarR family transcriptional regulator [Gammaproteobacteria bacterium]|nr:MarR family transcriptional regulator [Gammaproteobacteria bacterium]